jgi:hypothetical protein
MALKLNKIGPFEFISLQGEPDVPKRKTMVDSRPGVAGIAVWDQLAKGQPFSLISTVDLEDVDAAREEFEKYYEKIAEERLGIIKDDVNYVDIEALFIVLDVTMLSCKAVHTIVGGLNVDDGVDGVLLRCRWDLVGFDKNIQ